MHYHELPEHIIAQYRYAFQQARERREEYIEWIKTEIGDAIAMISRFDFVYVLGGLGAKHVKTLRTSYNTFLENYEGPKPEGIEEEMLEDDDNIETVLEYAMNITTALSNANRGNLPTLKDIEEINRKLGRIKFNTGFLELSNTTDETTEDPDHFIRSRIMLDSLHVRGNGYSQHVIEVFKELFAPHNGFLDMKHGFNVQDLFDAVMKLDQLVYSKVGNPGGSMISHKRFTDWIAAVGNDEIVRQMQNGKHFIQQFTEANPDLYDISEPDRIVAQHLDNVSGYDKLFWVIPQSTKEEAIFNFLSQSFGDNTVFFTPLNYKAFPLNDTNVRLKPLIKQDGKFYCFSLTLPYRNIFKIAERLIEVADGAYFENIYKGNNSPNSKDNYIEAKVLNLFQKLLPHTQFYHSLHYPFRENGIDKYPELDILGLSSDTVYIIEVKSGELNVKHRRGALKGLKDRLAETINEGSYQCDRAYQYIEQNERPVFDYKKENSTQQLILEKTGIQNYFKISVTFEYFSAVSVNPEALIKAGVMQEKYRGTWIVPLYDLMVFADLLNSEEDFNEYLYYRQDLYAREDVIFNDEIDILGFFLDGNFPLAADDGHKRTTMEGFGNDIDNYYEKSAVGVPMEKPLRKIP